MLNSLISLVSLPLTYGDSVSIADKMFKRTTNLLTDILELIKDFFAGYCGWQIFYLPCGLLLLIIKLYLELLAALYNAWQIVTLQSPQSKRKVRSCWRSLMPRFFWADPTAVNPRSFCKVCRQNGVFRRLEGEDGYSLFGQWICIRSPGELARRQYCPFCKLVLSLLPPAGPPPGRSSGIMQDYPIQLTAFPSPWLGYKVYFNGYRVGDVVQEKSRIERASVLNTQWARNLHDTCRKTHKACNGSAGLTTRLTTSIKILLVDVKENCLTEASSDYEYLALSYVRGGVAIPETKQHDLEHLKQPQSLNVLLSRAPAVVQDAIEVVRRLDKRYLWVDAFCIIHDSIHKHQHIAQMDVIYSQGLLSIVATSAKDASFGLPGLYPGSRLAGTALIDVHHSLVTNRRLSDILASSVYETRGWTLQERVLSTRCLHLSDWDAVFQCQELIQTEHHIMPNKADDPDCWDGPTMPALWPLVSPDGVNLTLRASFETYSRLVELYTGRQLSYTSDALSAFSGVLSAIEHLSGDQSRSGIPSKLLTAALLWVPKYQRGRVADQPHALRRNPAFPSWSWVGWTEQVSFFLSHFILGGTEQPLQSMRRWTMCDESPCSFTQLPQQEISPLNDISPLNPSVDALHFHARVVSSVHFASDRTSSVGSIGNGAFESYIRLSTGSNRDRYYGKLFGSPIPSFHDQRMSMCELVQLFRFVPPPLPKTSVVQDVFGAVIKTVRTTSLRDHTASEVDDFGKGKIPLMFVMLIEWKSAHAERLAVGYLYEDAWEMENPTLKGVILA
jgi:hypothetical protein